MLDLSRDEKATCHLQSSIDFSYRQQSRFMFKVTNCYLERKARVESKVPPVRIYRAGPLHACNCVEECAGDTCHSGHHRDLRPSAFDGSFDGSRHGGDTDGEGAVYGCYPVG